MPNKDVTRTELQAAMEGPNNVIQLEERRRNNASASVADSESSGSLAPIGAASHNLGIFGSQVVRIGSERRT